VSTNMSNVLKPRNFVPTKLNDFTVVNWTNNMSDLDTYKLILSYFRYCVVTVAGSSTAGLVVLSPAPRMKSP